MKRTKIRTLLVTLAGMLLSGALASTVLAQTSAQARWWSNPRVAEGLGLSDEQRESIEAIVYENESLNIDLKAAEKKANLELARLLDQPEFLQEAIDSAIDRVVDARCALTRSELESRAAIAGILSQEQRIKLMDFLAKVRERRDAPRATPRRRR